MSETNVNHSTGCLCYLCHPPQWMLPRLAYTVHWLAGIHGPRCEAPDAD